VHVVTLRYSERLVRSAVRAFALRSFAQGYVTWLLAACLGAMLLTLQLHDGFGGWWIGFFEGLLLVVVLLPLGGFIAHRRHSMDILRRMGSPVATLAYDERDLTMRSGLGATTLPWSSVREVWRFDEFWLLLLSRGQFVTLPLGDLDEQTRSWIVRTVARVK
jgi:hypothetical protein